MRHVLLSLVFAGLCGCQIVYKLPTRQGNVYDQKDLQKIQLGMTREQVHFVLGTPIATSPFREDRWDYVGYYKSPRGQVITRTVSLYFEGDTLARAEGLELDKDAGNIADPEAKTAVEREQGASDAGAEASQDDQTRDAATAEKATATDSHTRTPSEDESTRQDADSTTGDPAAPKASDTTGNPSDPDDATETDAEDGEDGVTQDAAEKASTSAEQA